MNRKIIAFATVFAAALLAFADPVSVDMAMAAANDWAAKNRPFDVGLKAQGVRTVCDDANASIVLWHQVSMSGGGCLIVAPVTEIEPIVAALERDPGELSAAHPLRGILTADMRGRLQFLGLYAAKSGAGLLGASPMPAADDEKATVAKEWADQQECKWARLGVVTARGAKLLEAESVGVEDPITVEMGIVPGFEKDGALTHWNQSNAGGGKCFNYYTPKNAVCGCVATALASVLQYFKVTGVKTADGNQYTSTKCTYNGKSYAEQFGEDAKTLLLDDGSGTDVSVYDWAALPSNWGGEAEASDTLTEDQRKILGQVAFDAGVAMDMAWSDGESGAYTAESAKALRNVFGFADARCVLKPQQDQYRKLIDYQIQAGAPVLMGIEGHAVVAVGYGRDSEGVERTRVFLGWGGSGDAWYALPYIDTKSTLAGSCYLSEVVNSITTMMAYAPEGEEPGGTVPVCGRLVPAMNAEVDCGGVKVKANRNGFFGARFAPAATEREITISAEGRTNKVKIGVECKAKNDELFVYDGAALCAMVPESVTMLLLNSETATSLDEAKEKALAAGKPCLFFSGTAGDAASEAVWSVIKRLDDEDVDGFTDKFVIAYFSFMPGTVDGDGNPSYGVFYPPELESGDQWSWFNGRLAWDDFAEVGATVTNIVDNGEGETTNITWVASEACTNAVMAVIDSGFELYGLESDDVDVNVSCAVENVTGDCEDDDWAQVWDEAFCGEFSHVLRAAETASFTAPAFHTNDQQAVFKCIGWSRYRDTGTKLVLEDSGDGNVCEFPPEAGADYEIVWSWEVTQVWVGAVVGTANKYAGGTVWPAEPYWADYCSDQLFVATPDEKSEIDYWWLPWEYEDSHYNGDLDEIKAASEVAGLSFCADRPMIGTAEFKLGGTLDTAKVTFVCEKPELAQYMEYVASGAELYVWGENEVRKGKVAFSPTRKTVTDGNGVTWECWGWQSEDANGEEGYDNEVFVNLDLTCDVTVTWLWREVEEPLEDAEAPLGPGGASALFFGETGVGGKVSNTVKGWWYALYSATELDGPWTLEAKGQATDTGVELSLEPSGIDMSKPQQFFRIRVTKEEPK